jgi:hypothetical protein
MSFNTSNIQADTFTGSVSLSAPIHYVAGIPISNNTGNLKLGDVDNAVVECLELESGTSVTAPLGEFDLIQTSGLISQAGLGEPIQVSGSLNLSNYSLNNVNSLTLANGATGAENQVLSVGATGALFWKTDTAGDVSQWATFPAVSTVNLGAQSLNGTYDKGEGINVITGLLMNNKSITGVSTLTTGFIQGTTGAIINIKDIVNIEGNVAGGFGIKNLQTLTLLGGLTGTAGQVLAVGATGNLEWKDDASGDVSQWATFDAVQDVNINNFALNSVQSISGYDGNNILLNNTLDMNYNNINTITNINCEKLLCQYRPDKIYYVSSNGSNSSGIGNIEAPFLTIQQALDYVNGDENNNYYYIIVLAGNYVENLTITKKVHLIGMATSPFSSSVGCAIGGSITINVGSNGGDLFNNAVNISGFLIGSQVSFVSTENSILNINDCYIYTDDNTSGRGLYFNPTCDNCRLRITNTQIISGGSSGLDPLVEITKSSSTTMNNVIINSKGVQNVLKFSGTATCDSISNCRFISDTASAVAPEIVSITATNSGTYTFSNCGFQYGSATNKTANPTSSGIRCSPSSGNPRVVILYCSFFLLGTNTAQYAVEDANHAQPNQMIVLYYMNGASLQNAFAIHANNNQNKFQLQVVS